MKGKLLGEVAVQFDRLQQQQQQRRPVPASSASSLPRSPRAPGCPPAHLRLPLPARGRREATGRHRRSILAPPSEGPRAASPPRNATV